jgi:hypothetical protein
MMLFPLFLDFCEVKNVMMLNKSKEKRLFTSPNSHVHTHTDSFLGWDSVVDMELVEYHMLKVTVLCCCSEVDIDKSGVGLVQILGIL